MSVLKITHENFNEAVINAKGTVILDFWADWCGPCKMIAPFVEEIAAAHPEITVGKVNVDDEPAIAAAYGIMSIPTLIKFKDGKAVDQQVGYSGKEILEAWCLR